MVTLPAAVAKIRETAEDLAMRAPFVCSLLMLLSLFPAGSEAQTIRRTPRNVILVIGDGLGAEQVHAARAFYGELMSFEELPFRGSVTTENAAGQITDSAAAGTAMATGFKVNNGVISVALPGDGHALGTLLEYYKAAGKSTGLVTTSYITDATPAAFGAHQSSRSLTTRIAADYMERSRPNVLFGGGLGLTPSLASASGYAVVQSVNGLLALDTEAANRVAALYGTSEFPYVADGPNQFPRLYQMASQALRILDNNANGFFLLVENELTDSSAHINDLHRNVAEVHELSLATEAVLSWATARRDTLVLVTSDHETGGLTVVGENTAGTLPGVSWSTSGHTSAQVPLYAWGFAAELFSGSLDNTDIPRLVKNAAVTYSIKQGAPCDFNGDRTSDFAILRRSPDGASGTVYIRYSRSGITQTIPFGNPAIDTYVTRDFDGDGKTDLSVWRKDQNQFRSWYVRQSTNLTVGRTTWGQAGDVPLAADFDADGVSDLSVFRPNDGSWWSIRSSAGAVSIPWGLPGDLPAAADFNRDGAEDFAVFRPGSGYWAVKSARSAAPFTLWKQWGLTGDVPMSGDYDGDGKADLVVWRPSNGTWYVCSSVTQLACESGYQLQFGLPGDRPQRADFDGDGILDQAVWRPSSGGWFVRKSSDGALLYQQWGLTGDVPLCS